jgi:hypothetical protein
VPLTTQFSANCVGRVSASVDGKSSVTPSRGDEVTVDGHPSPLEVVDVVWAPPRAKIAAIVKVRATALYPV